MVLRPRFYRLQLFALINLLTVVQFASQTVLAKAICAEDSRFPRENEILIEKKSGRELRVLGPKLDGGYLAIDIKSGRVLSLDFDRLQNYSFGAVGSRCQSVFAR